MACLWTQRTLDVQEQAHVEDLVLIWTFSIIYMRHGNLSVHRKSHFHIHVWNPHVYESFHVGSTHRIQLTVALEVVAHRKWRGTGSRAEDVTWLQHTSLLMCEGSITSCSFSYKCKTWTDSWLGKGNICHLDMGIKLVPDPSIHWTCIPQSLSEYLLSVLVCVWGFCVCLCFCA